MYTIPKNAQVALQSVKYALNGTIALSTNGRIMYQYFGEDLDATTSLKSMTDNSTVVPIRTPLVDTFEANDALNGSYPHSQQNKIRNYTVNEFSRAFESSLNNYIYHPNLMGNVSVNVNRDTDNKFIGFKINYDSPATTTDAAPADGFAIDLSNAYVRDETYDQAWTYASGVFTVNDPNDRGHPQSALLTEKPISANDGVLTVNFSNANASGKEWAVGLSRYVTQYDDITGAIAPEYFSLRKSGDTRPTKKIGFYDYLVCRKGNVLKVYHTPYDSGDGDDGLICSRELELNNTVAQDYDLDTNTTAYHSVRFTVSGQTIKIELIHAGASDTVYEYDAAQTNAQQLKATCISTWQLFPVLYVDSPNAGLTNSLTVTNFIGCDMPSDWTIDGENLVNAEPSWYTSVEQSNNIQVAQEVETRPWNDQATLSRSNYITYSGLDTDGLFDQYDNFLIMKPSEVYAPSSGANSEEFLGFTGESPTNSWVIDESVATKKIFTSSSIPQMLSNKSIFVKLNNFTQKSVNALQGNQSAILSHVPRFDGQVQVGRMYYEPNNLIYLDLNNSNELNVNSFDISLVYSNEQYVEELTGQTIVCLHFRARPS
jgi:hypothetical protein